MNEEIRAHHLQHRPCSSSVRFYLPLIAGAFIESHHRNWILQGFVMVPHARRSATPLVRHLLTNSMVHTLVSLVSMIIAAEAWKKRTA